MARKAKSTRPQRESEERLRAQHLRQAAPVSAELRIIGGKWRGRKIRYNGNPGTRPMKDRTREAIFNLVGPAIEGMHAVDLFAGTGALGLEALSRGASRATLFERHLPTVRTIRDNLELLEAEPQCQVVFGNTFFHAPRHPLPHDVPWAVFISPPYELFVTQSEAMLQLINHFAEQAPAGSKLVVESDDRFDPSQLPQPGEWDTRAYRPAVVSIHTC